MAAGRATGRTETPGQDPTPEIAAEFTLHTRRHPLAVPVPFARQREVGLQMFLDQTVEDGPLGAAPDVGSGSASPVGWRPCRQRDVITRIAVSMYRIAG